MKRGFATPGMAGAPPAQSSGSVSIDRLSLRLPGSGAAFGRRVAQSAVERASERLPPGLSGDFASLRLKVHPRRMSEDALSEAIADALVQALERRRP